jgi:hypothetical protein
MPTIHNVLYAERKRLLTFCRAIFSIAQKYLSPTFNGSVLLLPRPFVAFGATSFTPAMIAVRSLFMLKKQLKRFGLFTTEARFHGHFQRRRLALARSPFLAFAATADILAQNDFLRPSSALVLGLGAGGLSLLPVAALYLALPLAVRPAPALVDSFSPRPTDSDTI